MDEKDPRLLVDHISGNAGYLRTLLSAADSRTLFFLENRSILGPYRELLCEIAADISNLLILTRGVLEQIEGQLEALTDVLYGTGSPAAVQ